MAGQSPRGQREPCRTTAAAGSVAPGARPLVGVEQVEQLVPETTRQGGQQPLDAGELRFGELLARPSPQHRAEARGPVWNVTPWSTPWPTTAGPSPARVPPCGPRCSRRGRTRPSDAARPNPRGSARSVDRARRRRRRHAGSPRAPALGNDRHRVLPLVRLPPHCTMPRPCGPSRRNVWGTTSQPSASDTVYAATSRWARVPSGKSQSGRSPATGL